MNSKAAFVSRLVPDYRERRIFVRKLRWIAFAGFCLIYFYFLQDVIWQAKGVLLVVASSLLLANLCNREGLFSRQPLLFLTLQIMADLVGMTAVLYLTGGPYSPYYTIYLLYVCMAGMLYSHLLAAVTALIAVFIYAAFLLGCHMGIIPPLILDYGDNAPIPTYTPLAHLLFASIFLLCVAYMVKVSSFFSQERERTLEKKNRELTALMRMGSSIRSSKALREVTEGILDGLIDGLGFRTVLLVRFDWFRRAAVISLSRRTPHLGRIREILGRDPDGMEVPLASIPAIAMQEMERHRIIFRRELSELAERSEWSGLAEKCDAIQQLVGAKRIVIMPIVIEEEALGAILGFSEEPFVEEEHVATMEAFANQSALSFEAAALIERLRGMNQKLEEANRVKSEFLATMSHELRTPLTAIIGFSELLVEGVMGDLTVEQRESLGEVLHNAADLLDLINNLLDLTKIESGKMRLDVRSFDVVETIRRSIQTVSLLVQKKEQSLELSLPPAALTIVGDERKIQQVCVNLLANANKFTPQKGHIRLKVFLHDPLSFRSSDPSHPALLAKVQGMDRIDKGFLELSVEDDGIGISEDQLEIVFDMFHQADKGATRNFGGTGVGLALAKKFVELHGGRIWAESVPGKGTKFIVAIPLNSVNNA